MNALAAGGLILLVLIILSGFFSASRAALANAKRSALREQAEQGNSRAEQAVTLAEDSSRMLNTFRLATTLADFAIASLFVFVALPPTLDALSVVGVVSSVATGIAFVVLIGIGGGLTYLLTDVLPEASVARNPDRWAMWLAPAAQITLALLSPFATMIQQLRSALSSSPEGDNAQVTEEEIMTLVDAGEEEGSIQLEEKEMIYSIFQLDDTLTREIMVPRIDVVALDLATPLSDAREVIIKAGHSRIPIYTETLDTIEGMLYAKDLLAIWHQKKEGVTLKSLLREAMFVPESKRVPDLLSEMQSQKVHLAIVIDEYGGTAGLVTIEDIVEEIVGEILDEYDSDDEALYELVSKDTFIFDAKIDLDDFNRLVEADLPDELGDTLAGFIYGTLGKVPDEGETVEANALRMEVLSVADRRIRKVQVTRLSTPLEKATEHDGNSNSHR